MINNIKDFLIKYDNFLTAIVLFVVLIVGVSFPQTSDNGLRAEVDNLTYQVDLVNFRDNQLSGKVDEAIRYSTNLSSKISNDFYRQLKSYDSKLSNMDKNLAFVMTNVSTMTSSLNEIGGLEGYNTLASMLNSITHEVTVIKLELNLLNEYLTGLDNRIKALE